MQLMTGAEDAEDVAEISPGSHRRTDIRRFAIAVATGWAIAAVPYFWVLTDLWNSSPSLLRTVLPNHTLSNFYDAQGRALLDGHLSMSKQVLGAEAFLHDGHAYMYFGLFPALLRLPILIVTHSLDGRLTALSVLVAWLVTGVLSAVVLWKCRFNFRGDEVVTLGEGILVGTLVAGILGGSALVNLAAYPWVYSEDIAWSVALLLASIVTMMTVVESPSWRRIVLLGLVVLSLNLTRGTEGLGASIAVVLVGLYLRWGRSGEDRRWWIPTIVAGLIPLMMSIFINILKFGSINGYPLQDQVFFRSQHLGEINGGHYFSLVYLPTGIKTYLASPGVHLSAVFPFVSLPLAPVQAVGHVALFGVEHVTSVPGSMPLLFILSIAGMIALVMPSTPWNMRLIAVPLFAAALPIVALLVFGFVDNRFVGDFMPFLIVASAVGVWKMWSLARHWGRGFQLTLATCAVLLAFYGVVANVAMAATPTGWWSDQQAAAFVREEVAVTHTLGVSLDGVVRHGRELPNHGFLGEIFVVSNCHQIWFSPATGYLQWLEVDNPKIRGGISCRSLGGS